MNSESSSLAIRADLPSQPLPGQGRWASWLQRWLPASYAGRVLAGLLLFAAVWLSELAASSLTAPMDNIEQLTWVRSLQWGYYKHPPLPTWLLWPLVKLFGFSALDTYVLGAAITLAALGIFTALLVRMRGQAYATLALLATLCITFYNGRLYYYNHNTVLMLFVSASALAFWQAMRTGRLVWWAWLGLALGLGGLSKYQVAITGTCIALVWLQQRAWRQAALRRGAVLAVAVASFTLLPHLVWLVQSNFLPVHYAMATSLGVSMSGLERVQSVSHWLADLLFNRALPAWLLLALALTHSRPSAVVAAPVADDPAGPGRLARHASLSRAILLSYGLVPLLFMVATGLLFGSELQLQWGTAFSMFAVPAVMELLAMRRKGITLSLRRAAVAFVLLQTLLLNVNWFTSARAPARLQSKHWCRFPSAKLARVLAGPAREALGGPIRLIESGSAVAGALALQLPEHPWVLIDGKPEYSPWVPADVLASAPRLLLRQFDGEPEAGWTVLGPDFPGLAWKVGPPGA
jgi:hypothetical protein